MKELLEFTLQQQEGHLSRAADEDTPAAGAASTSPRDRGKSPSCPEWMRVNNRGNIFFLPLERKRKTGEERKAKYRDAGT